MRSWTRTVPAVCLLAALPCPAPACSLCANIRQLPTLRQEATQPTAKLVFYGFLANPKLRQEVAGAGTTDFHIREILKTSRAVPPSLLKRRGDVLVIRSYVPVEDPKRPPQYLVFCDINQGRIDPYRYVAVSSEKTIDYVRKVLALDPKDAARMLAFYFEHLDSPVREVSSDAFMEFAKTPDQIIGPLSRGFNAAKLRRWLRDPKTPEERLSLFAFLLGGCGNRDDVAWFQKLLARPDDRFTTAYDGLVGGYIQLVPRDGWALTEKTLREGKQSLLVRLAMERTLRLYLSWKPRETRALVLRCLGAMLAQGELTDLAVENLRRGKMWELTEQVLSQYGRKGLDAPIQKRAIVRYALSCPEQKAKAFVANLRRSDPILVEDVAESLKALEGR
jgi:hypothetical protein